VSIDPARSRINNIPLDFDHVEKSSESFKFLTAIQQDTGNTIGMPSYMKKWRSVFELI